jgi:hypothetical protein
VRIILPAVKPGAGSNPHPGLLRKKAELISVPSAAGRLAVYLSASPRRSKIMELLQDLFFVIQNWGGISQGRDAADPQVAVSVDEPHGSRIYWTQDGNHTTGHPTAPHILSG